jgi:hypothetical protein
MKKPSLGLIGVLATLVVAVSGAGLLPAGTRAPASGATVTTTVSDDTYVGPATTKPLGNATTLAIGGSDPDITYLKFSVKTLPSGPQPLNVSLDLTPAHPATGTPTLVTVHTVADTTWSESTLTSANAPFVGRVAGLAVLNADTDRLQVNLTATVRRTGTYAFALTATSGSAQRLFQSKEGATGANKPRLTLTRGAGSTPPPSASPTPSATPSPTPTPTPTPSPSGSTPPVGTTCTPGAKLVPNCGVMLGVAPQPTADGETHAQALAKFESEAGGPSDIYHSYHHGTGSMFPSAEEIKIARDPSHPHLLFINWKPQVASWAAIAAGDPAVDSYLDKLAAYIKTNYPEPFFFTVHHEPENEVVEKPGSGYEAEDYAAMYRHVIQRLRGDGLTNLVTVMDYMAYGPLDAQPWFNALYPGDDVVDWVAWDMYGYSEPGQYGYGDFAEMLNRPSGSDWKGIYPWAAARFPGKPFMVAEWGVWYSSKDPGHQADVYNSVGSELAQFPQIKAMVYFDSANSDGKDDTIDRTPGGLAAYRAMCALPQFEVTLPTPVVPPPSPSP